MARPPLEAGTVDELVDPDPQLLAAAALEAATTRQRAARGTLAGSAIGEALLIEATRLATIASALTTHRLELREVTPA